MLRQERTDAPDPLEGIERLALPRATIACIQLPTDLILDEEAPALISRLPGVRLRLQKVQLDGEALDFANYETARGRIRSAAATLRPKGSIDAVGLACTSLAFALGRDDVRAELRAGQPGAQVTDMATATLAALDRLGLRRPALLTPYVDELHQRNLELLRGAGREVVVDSNLGFSTDEEITSITPAALRELALAADDPSADCLVIACSAFRTLGSGYLDALEADLGKPVLSSAQVFLRHLLDLAGVEDSIGGYGSLFRRHTSKTPVLGAGSTRPAELEDSYSGRVPEPGLATRVDPIYGSLFRRETTEPPVARGGSSSPTGFEDPYPSRVPEPGLVERVDPVVAPGAREAGPLSAAQVDRFDRRGVLVLPQVFSHEEVTHLRETTEALRTYYESLTYEDLDSTTDMRVITERGGALIDDEAAPVTLKSIWQVHLPPEDAKHMKFAAGLSRRTVCDSRLVDTAKQLIGDDVYIHQSRVNFQRGIGPSSRGGSGFLWHQDFEQWHSEDGMPRMRAVSMAILLERAVPANGALMVMPGTHRQLVQAYGGGDDADRYAKGALSSGPEIPTHILGHLADEHGIEHCRGEPGDVVLFDSNLIHGSHTNISPWGRSMFFAVYNSVSNTPAPELYGANGRRPEHIGSHDLRYAGVPLPSLEQSLAAIAPG
ncbi:MAG: ectoine hydroxylase [Planctomycetota bacterium]|jgi:ectoine hydroxylase